MMVKLNILELGVKVLKIVGICLIFILASCGSKNNSASTNPRLRKMDSARGCIMESELLARGIVGGETVQLSDADSKMVVMLISDGMVCTAAPIHKNVLLTAAHCIGREAGQTRVIFYPSVSCESGYDQMRHSVLASHTLVHESFNADAPIQDTQGDLALVFIDQDVPSEYPQYNLADPDSINTQSNLLLYGYGRMRSSGGGAGILRKTSLPPDSYGVDGQNKKVVLNQSNGTGICNGDSGGPSLVTTQAGDLRILGVNSYVIGPQSDVCSERSVQTLAYSYQDWIIQKIAEHVAAGQR